MHEMTSSSSSSEELVTTKTSTTTATKTTNALTKTKTKQQPTAGVGAAATTAETLAFIFHDNNPKTKALFFVGILSGIGNGLVRGEHRTFSLFLSVCLSFCLSVCLSLSFLTPPLYRCPTCQHPMLSRSFRELRGFFPRPFRILVPPRTMGSNRSRLCVTGLWALGVSV